jgi:hypothetical protein
MALTKLEEVRVRLLLGTSDFRALSSMKTGAHARFHVHGLTVLLYTRIK